MTAGRGWTFCGDVGLQIEGPGTRQDFLQQDSSEQIAPSSQLRCKPVRTAGRRRTRLAGRRPGETGRQALLRQPAHRGCCYFLAWPQLGPKHLQMRQLASPRRRRLGRLGLDLWGSVCARRCRAGRRARRFGLPRRQPGRSGLPRWARRRRGASTRFAGGRPLWCGRAGHWPLGLGARGPGTCERSGWARESGRARRLRRRRLPVTPFSAVPFSALGCLPLLPLLFSSCSQELPDDPDHDHERDDDFIHGANPRPTIRPTCLPEPGHPRRPAPRCWSASLCLP